MRSQAVQPWWGSLSLEAGEARRSQVGPLIVWFQPVANGMLIAWESLPISPDGEYPPPEVETAVPPDPLIEREEVERFAFDGAGIEIVLCPSLADRPVITSPRKPLSILPQTRVTIFASSPLWLQARVGAHLVFDRAVDRPPDTWFGPTTLRGELCYATKAFCRLRLEEIRTPLHRAVTAITVNNRADSAIRLTRIKLPAPNLALYAEAGGRLWTEDVTFERTEEDEGFASLRIDHRPPQHAHSPERISEPREEAAVDVVTRAFSSIFPWRAP